VFGEQPVDWGYHSGIKRGPHTGDYAASGYCLLDEPEFEPYYYKMIDELAAKYCRDGRLQMWNVWNEPGNSNRKNMSLKAMEKYFEIIRSHNPIQPLTADVFTFDAEFNPNTEIQQRAAELSDIITFHWYYSFDNLVLLTESLRRGGRPLICSEWLNRLSKNDVETAFPFFYFERIGSYHWGLMAGYSQTYEPWGGYFIEYMKEGSTVELFKWQHDLYRMNGLPYDPKEIKLIKRFCAYADKRDGDPLKKDFKGGV
jgi:hypothetical protein